MHIPYTILREQIYYFNRRFGVENLRISLRTSSHQKALTSVSQLNDIINNMEVSKSSLKDIRKTASIWLQRNLEHELVLEANRPPIREVKQDVAQQDIDRRNIESLDEAKSILKDREHHAYFEQSSQALAQEFTLQLNDAEMKVLSYNIAQANKEFFERLTERNLGGYGVSMAVSSDQDDEYRTSELIDKYLKEKEREVKGPTLNKIKNFLYAFLEIAGDMPVNRFKRDEATLLMDGFYSYPLNRTRHGNAELTLEALKNSGAKAISHTTVGDAHNKVSSFFKWCVDMDYCNRNYLEGRGPSAKQTASSRRPWKRAELVTLFEHETFKGNDKKNWHYWLPVMALSTGARMEELCTLRGTDIKQEDGVWVFDITDDEDEKKLKTASSKRRVPIHNYLITLGIQNFAKAQGDNLLFPDLLEYSTDNLGHGPSKWFGRLKKDKLKLPEEVSFHSFRHSMRDMLTDVGAGLEMNAATLGHEHKSTTFGTYGSAIRPSVLNTHIQKLPIKEILKGVIQHPTGKCD